MHTFRLERRGLVFPQLYEGLLEPHKASRIVNAIRRIRDKMSPPKRKRLPTEYNRRQRDLYHRRVPMAMRDLRPNAPDTPKRTAPEKRLGMRLRVR